MKKITLLLMLFALTSAYCVESKRVDPLLYADPIPTSITYPMLNEMGVKPEQRHLFKVCRRVPLEMGGTNARDNLIVLSVRDAFTKSLTDHVIMGRVQKNMMTFAEAVKVLKEWKP
jgi:hypothetical protein